MASGWAEQLDWAVDESFERMVEIRRYLHAHPERSGREEQTTVYLTDRLREAGFHFRAGTGDRGLIVDPAEAPRRGAIALRADIDALRMADAKQVEYRSQVEGVMHACGHDAHAATVVGAMLALQAVERAGALPWPVAWRAIFQPAEETSSGAREMIAAGALEGVEAILGLHVEPARDLGKIGVRNGVFTATCDELEVRIEGRGGHASRPHESIDPIAAAAQLISSIYLFVPRAVDSHNPVVITIGQIAGGDTANVIPNEVQLRGTIRTLGGAVQEQTKDHIRQLARGLAEASRTQITVAFHPGPAAVRNDRQLTALTRRAASQLLGPEQVEEIDRPSMGGEDFAHYLEWVPGAMFRLGCRSPTTGDAPLHSPMFDIDERAMGIGAKILARTAVLWSDPQRPKNAE